MVKIMLFNNKKMIVINCVVVLILFGILVVRI